MKPIKLIFGLLFMLAISVLVTSMTGFNTFFSFAILLVASFLPMPKGTLNMGLPREMWESDIVKNLWRNNTFMKRCYIADQYVTGGKIVHVPYAGGASGTTKNLTNFPANAAQRTDTEGNYMIDVYRTNPRHILYNEQFDLSYDKRQSIIVDDQAALLQTTADGLLFKWALSTNIDGSTTKANQIITDGGTGATAQAPTISGATGTRFAFDKNVFGKAKLSMDAADIDPNGRVALLTAYHHQQLINSFTDAEKTGFYAAADMKNGIVGRYLGIDIMMRSSVLRYRYAGGVWSPVDEHDPAFAAGTADSAASLFWQDQTTERAFGGVKMFDDPERADWYGGIISFELRMGGRIRRQSGVFAVIEGIAS